MFGGLGFAANVKGIQNRSPGRARVHIGDMKDLEAISTFLEFISHRLG